MRALFLVLLLATAADARVIQPWQGGTGCSSPKTIAALPGSPATGDFCTVTDGASGADCTTGGGSEVLVCLYDGSAWTSVGGGGGVTDIWVDEAGDTMTGTLNGTDVSMTGDVAAATFTEGGTDIGAIYVDEAGDSMTGQLTLTVSSGVPFVVYDTTPATSSEVAGLSYTGLTGTPSVNDEGFIGLHGYDVTPASAEMCRITWGPTDVSAGAVTGEMDLECSLAGTPTSFIKITPATGGSGSTQMNPGLEDHDFAVNSFSNYGIFECNAGTEICNFLYSPTVDGTDIADTYVDEDGDAMTGTLDIDTTSANALQVYSSTGLNANYAQMGCEGNGSPNTFCNMSLTGDNDAGSETIYAQLRHTMTDATNTSIDGKFAVLVKQDGSLRSLQNWTSSSSGVMTVLVNPANLDVDFRVDGTTDGLISADAGNDSVDLGAVVTVSGANEQHTFALSETGSTSIASTDWLKADITVSPGATATGTTNVAIMGMITNDTTQNVGIVQAGKFQTSISAANGGGARGLQGRLEVSGSAALGAYEGLQFNTVWDSTGNSTLGGYSAFNNFGWSSTGNIGVATASVVTYNRFDLENNTGTRSTTNVRIGEFDMHRFANATNTTITNLMGVYIDGDWGGPTITSAYQLYLTSPDSGPTNTYAIYQLDNSNNATNLLDSATTFGDITHHNTKGTAPASCSIGDLYVDNSGGFCACTAANTWTNISGVGNCT